MYPVPHHNDNTTYTCSALQMACVRMDSYGHGWHAFQLVTHLTYLTKRLKTIARSAASNIYRHACHAAVKCVPTLILLL